MAVVECWFDFSSPFGYLGTTQIERVAAEHDRVARLDAVEHVVAALTGHVVVARPAVEGVVAATAV